MRGLGIVGVVREGGGVVGGRTRNLPESCLLLKTKPGKQAPHGSSTRPLDVPVATTRTAYRWTAAPAARAHALVALYPAEAGGMMTLAGKGYVGAGIGISTPIKGPKPDPSVRSYSQVQAHLRVPADRANALLKGFKALKRVTLDSTTITKNHRHRPSHTQFQPRPHLMRKAH